MCRVHLSVYLSLVTDPPSTFPLEPCPLEKKNDGFERVGAISLVTASGFGVHLSVYLSLVTVYPRRLLAAGDEYSSATVKIDVAMVFAGITDMHFNLQR